MINTYISSLVQYGLRTGLIGEADRIYVTNQILQLLQLDSYEAVPPVKMQLRDILQGILTDAVNRGLCEDTVTAKDLFDTKLMGLLTPLPREVRARFADLYADRPEKATDWFYQFSQDTNDIRRDRIEKDIRWKTSTEYGNLDITINLSKPEKDPRSIAAAKAAPQSAYPKCQLCAENEGYAGRMNHPARQNHRVIPITLDGSDWYLQYSPYVYYNEHCIAFNSVHTPMVINRAAFSKLLDFVTLFPHYFIGSNADLPVVGGSILSHEHFQGGRYCFPMEKAAAERTVEFCGFEDVQAEIVKWPLSVIRLRSSAKARLVDLAEKILQVWRGYTDADACLFAETEGTPHHTITPIARRRGEAYELDLVLRSNLATKEHPMGLYHPHAELHHIKRENIGLIEVMGLAVLPARLKQELADLETAILEDLPLSGDLEKHAQWVAEMKNRCKFTKETIGAVLKMEVGRVFARCLEDAGVYKRTAEGRAAFLRFVEHVNQEEIS